MSLLEMLIESLGAILMLWSALIFTIMIKTGAKLDHLRGVMKAVTIFLLVPFMCWIGIIMVLFHNRIY